MQKGIGAAVCRVVHANHRRLSVRQVGVVLGMFGQPLTGQRLQGVQWLPGAGFGVDAAEESAHIFLGGIEHGAGG